MVHLKRMICTGFKSFRNRTVVHFDKGFTAIVGSNGSGKSNIIDAFSFVLGELSSKSLRANNIKDLISNGGKGAPPSDSATVEIIFDNSDKKFTSDLTEISILRKIDRLGNGIYKLHGKRSTRKEILDFLDLAGVLPNSTNMIMQGELFRLINMNINERRQMVEEIAGISSYNEKKQSAETELAQVQTNLGQISLLLNEVHNQLEQLQKEKNDAERYLFLCDQEKIRTNALYHVRIATAKQQIATFITQKAHIEQEIKTIQEEEQKWQNEIAFNEAKVEEITPKITELQDTELIQLTTELKTLKDRITELRASIKYAQQNHDSYEHDQHSHYANLKHLDTQEVELNEEITSIQTQKQMLTQKIETKTLRIHDLESQLRDIDSQYLILREKLKNNQDQREEISKNYNHIDTDAHVLRSKLTSLRETKEKTEQQLFQAQKTLEQYHAQLQHLHKSRKQLLGDFPGKEDESIESQIKMLEEELVQAQVSQSQAQQRYDRMYADTIALKSKLKVVQQFTANNRALEAIKKLRNTQEFKGIYGTIAELGLVDAKFAVAMEMAAGSRFNYVVVNSARTAESCVQYLKKNELGRASFIPLDEIRINPFVDPLPTKPTIYGLATDLITFDRQFYKAFEFVFGRTIIVEDLSTARTLNLPVKRVTLDGDIIDGSNLITGGQKEKPKGIGFALIEQHQLEEYESETAVLSQSLTQISDHIQNMRENISRLYKAKISGVHQTHEIDEQIAVLKTQISQIEGELHQKERDLAECLNQIQEVEAKYQQCQQSLAEISVILTKNQTYTQDLQTQIDSSAAHQIKTVLSQEETELKRLEKDLNELEVVLAKKLTTLHETISSTRKTYQAQLEQLALSLTNVNQLLSEANSELQTKDYSVGKLEEQLIQKSEIVARLLNERRTYLFQVSEAKTSIGQLQNQVHPLIIQLATMGVKREELELKLNEWACLLQPDLPFPEELHTQTESDHQAALAQITTEKTALGAVNLRAIATYRDINTRYTELIQKNDQVIKERESIMEFIASLEAEKKRVFLKTFNGINTNFALIFTKLSPGGEAHLELENPDSPFDGGVLMMARPGEKKMCLIQALSGGERSLCTIALILGIQMHVPSPYYILDEVDAALDDVNTALVADIIKELSQNSQFIMITHRSVSMARSDHLLGVSNTEGITSVINLSIRNILDQLKAEENQEGNVISLEN